MTTIIFNPLPPSSELDSSEMVEILLVRSFAFKFQWMFSIIFFKWTDLNTNFRGRRQCIKSNKEALIQWLNSSEVGKRSDEYTSMGYPSVLHSSELKSDLKGSRYEPLEGGSGTSSLTYHLKMTQPPGFHICPPRPQDSSKSVHCHATRRYHLPGKKPRWI